jgi:hypothetical protein
MHVKLLIVMPGLDPGIHPMDPKLGPGVTIGRYAAFFCSMVCG